MEEGDFGRCEKIILFFLHFLQVLSILRYQGRPKYKMLCYYHPSTKCLRQFQGYVKSTIHRENRLLLQALLLGQ